MMRVSVPCSKVQRAPTKTKAGRPLEASWRPATEGTVPGITLIVGTAHSSQKGIPSLEIPGDPPGVILQESQSQHFQFRLVIFVTPQPNFLASILQTSALEPCLESL